MFWVTFLKSFEVSFDNFVCLRLNWVMQLHATSFTHFVRLEMRWNSLYATNLFLIVLSLHPTIVFTPVHIQTNLYPMCQFRFEMDWNTPCSILWKLNKQNCLYFKDNLLTYWTYSCGQCESQWWSSNTEISDIRSIYVTISTK